MPTFRKLDADEVRRGGKALSARAQTQREYDNYLAEFAPDEYGEAVIDENESKLTVRNRLRAAATRRGLEINFLRSPGPVIRFQVTTPSAEQAPIDGEDSDEVAESGAANESSAEGGAESNGGSGNSQEEEQFRQQEQAEGPQPTRRRRKAPAATE